MNRFEKLSDAAKREIFEARKKINNCERELDRAENDVQDILDKYGLNSADEMNLSDNLPISLYLKDARNEKRIMQYKWDGRFSYGGCHLHSGVSNEKYNSEF